MDGHLKRQFSDISMSNIGNIPAQTTCFKFRKDFINDKSMFICQFGSHFEKAKQKIPVKFVFWSAGTKSHELQGK